MATEMTPRMSEGEAPVSQRVAIGVRERRRLIEGLAVRYPKLGMALGGVVLRLPAASLTRRAAVRSFTRVLFEAANRGDWEVTFALLPPDFEVITPPELVGLGFEPSYRGSEGRLRFNQRWVEDLGAFQQDSIEAVDCGDRILILARMRFTGLASGAPLESEVAYLLTISDGRVVREELWRSHAEGLAAAGLRRN